MADVRENFEEKYTKVIENFQQKLMDADNFHGGDRPDYKEFWQAWRQQGPAMLNLTKELMTYFKDTDNWYKENKHIIDRAMYEEGAREAELEYQQDVKRGLYGDG